MSVLTRWRARLRVRKQLERNARKRYIWHATIANLRLLKKRRAQVAYAERVIDRHDNVVAGTHPGSPVPGQKAHAATHQTAGLAGYPAYDYMAPAGTPCVAPVTGEVTRLSGHNPANGPTNGPHGPFGWSLYLHGDNGKTYFLTHLGTRTVHVGQRVRQGQKIGTVANYARHGGADHIHQGVHG